MNTGCPRSSVRDTALQLLQVLDKRFFGSGCVELLPPILPSESPVTAREYYILYCMNEYFKFKNNNSASKLIYIKS